MNRKDVTKPQPREVNWVTHTRINLKDFIMILRCSHASCCSSSARCHGSSLLVIAYGRSCDNIIVGRGAGLKESREASHSIIGQYASNVRCQLESVLCLCMLQHQSTLRRTAPQKIDNLRCGKGRAAVVGSEITSSWEYLGGICCCDSRPRSVVRMETCILVRLKCLLKLVWGRLKPSSTAGIYTQPGILFPKNNP